MNGKYSPPLWTRRQIVQGGAAAGLGAAIMPSIACRAVAHGSPQHRVDHGRRPGLCGPFLYRPACICNAQHRPHRARGPVPAPVVRKLRSLLGHSHGPDHRSLPVPAPGWPRRAHWQRQRYHRSGSGSPHPAFAVAGSGISHFPGWQVASGILVAIRAVAERLPELLRRALRCRRLFPAPLRRSRSGAAAQLHDGDQPVR